MAIVVIIFITCLSVNADIRPVTDLSKAVQDAGSMPTTLYITQDIAVNSDLTVPENITLSVERGGKIIVAQGVTLTINGSVDAGLYQIFDGLGVVMGDIKVEAIYPEWFFSGEYNNEASDWAPAINKAISLANSGCLKVKLQARKYNVMSAVNLAYSGANKADMTLEGSVRSTQYERGTLLIGNTGEGKCVIETSDSDGIHLKNIGVTRGKSNPSSIGILQARASATEWAGDQYHENVYVNMRSNPSSNGGFGTIGIVNIAGEETKWHNLQVWANLPLIIAVGNGGGKALGEQSAVLNELGKLQRTRGDFSGTDSYVIQSSVGQEPVQFHSNTVFELSGLGRLIAYDHVSPCVLLNNAAMVNLGHTFMQLQNSGIKGITPGQYKYAIENWNVWHLKHQGSVEGASGYLLNRRGLFNADVTATIAGSGETKLPAIYLFDDNFDGHFYHSTILNSNFNIFSYDENRPLIASKRQDGNDSAPMYFTIRNCSFKTTMPLNMTTVSDARIFRKTFDTSWQFKDGSVRIGNNTISIDISKNLGKSGSNTDLFRIHMPTFVKNAGAFSASVSIDGALTNALSQGVKSPSVNSFTSVFDVINASDSINIRASKANTRMGKSTDSDSNKCSINGLAITAVPNNSGNYVTVKAKPSCKGSQTGDVSLSCTVTLRWSGGARDTVLIERL